MEKCTMALLAAFGVASLFILAILFGTLGGAFVGWVVGWFFTETITAGFAAFGVDISRLDMWQVGAFLGFVGGFFKSSLVTTSGSKDKDE